MGSTPILAAFEEFGMAPAQLLVEMYGDDMDDDCDEYRRLVEVLGKVLALLKKYADDPASMGVHQQLMGLYRRFGVTDRHAVADALTCFVIPS